jgi:hypothetical protein
MAYGRDDGSFRGSRVPDRGGGGGGGGDGGGRGVGRREADELEQLAKAYDKSVAGVVVCRRTGCCRR